MIYFSAVPVRMDSVDGEQYEKLRAFKENLRSRGLCDEYEDFDIVSNEVRTTPRAEGYCELRGR